MQFGFFAQQETMSKNKSNAREVIRGGFRLLEEKENNVIVLRQAIEEGINSGITHDFDPADHLGKLKAAKRE